MDVEQFLEHHGVKGMQWETTRQQTLDRIYRVAAGTASRKEKQKEMLKLLTKDIMKDNPIILHKPVKPHLFARA